jgi:pimeloyl-ACP methyl ester carboxylesterase
MGNPAELHLIDRPADPGLRPPDGGRPGTVVFVHGSLDRADSFGRVARRLSEFRVVAYDRRGYQDSRALGPGTFPQHVSDLLTVIEGTVGPGERILVVGHSLGGALAVAAALAQPERFVGVAAFEPPMCWRPSNQLGNLTEPAGGESTDQAVIRFFSTFGGPTSWERLSGRARAERLADGPALAADLRSARGAVRLEAPALLVPAVFGRGTAGSVPHLESVAWLAGHVRGSVLYEIDGAGHGAHLSHPDAFAGFVRLAWEHSARTGPPDPQRTSPDAQRTEEDEEETHR